MKAASAFLAFVLGGLLLFVFYLIWIEPHCRASLVPPRPPEIESQNRTENQSKATYQHHDSTNSDHYTTAYSFAAIKATLAKAENAEPNSDAARSRWKPTGWWEKFFCDAKITDIALAFFTYCLIVVGGFQARYLYHTVVATRTAAEHIPKVEGAVIYGGIKFGEIVIEQGTRCVKVTISMANYGKTPGFIKHIETGWSKLEDLPDEPFYTDCFVVSDLYFAEMTMDEVRRTPAIVTVPADGQHVIFQRVFYDDIFGNSHFSGSAYRFFPEGEGIRSEPLRGKPAYWKRE